MPGEILSRPLSPAARTALINFVAAYIESVKQQTVDNWAEVAKVRAKELLETDIDIMVFVTTVATMYSSSGVSLLMAVVKGQQHPLDVATAIVRIVEEGFRRDKQMRTQ